MPLAILLLREEAPASLATLVEKSQQRRAPHLEYELQLHPPTRLDLVLSPKPETPDEGFESDIDSLSIVSSDGSVVETKTAETDSANGSAGSDSDTEPLETVRRTRESHNLVDCVCYADVRSPDVLVFVIKREALVFKFADLNDLRHFYLNFTAVKAVTNQKAYNNSTAKFNLLQRTDNNGVTHIEITREPDIATFTAPNEGSTNIISLNTPESSERKLDSTSNQQLVTSSSNVERCALRRVWNSAEDLLNSPTPRRPERRRKVKGRAPPPPPPPTPNSDVLRGEYVRVNVTVDKDFIAKSQLKEKRLTKPTLITLLTPKPKIEQSWTNSVPRLVRKQRSRSETRAFTPMAYRYIDTTPAYSMGNRLFGLSPKLRDFGSEATAPECRWNGSYKSGNLKSLMKKDENKKKNEKKVTFSAYTTVQVV